MRQRALARAGLLEDAWSGRAEVVVAFASSTIIGPKSAPARAQLGEDPVKRFEVARVPTRLACLMSVVVGLAGCSNTTAATQPARPTVTLSPGSALDVRLAGLLPARPPTGFSSAGPVATQSDTGDRFQVNPADDCAGKLASQSADSEYGRDDDLDRLYKSPGLRGWTVSVDAVAYGAQYGDFGSGTIDPGFAAKEIQWAQQGTQDSGPACFWSTLAVQDRALAPGSAAFQTTHASEPYNNDTVYAFCVLQPDGNVIVNACGVSVSRQTAGERHMVLRLADKAALLIGASPLILIKPQLTD
jgi:hypothetical protein